MATDMSNQQYLLNKQYQTSVNLNARIQLHERFSTNPANWQRWVFDQFEIAPASQILELGTGSGQLWRQNLDRVPADWQITLSDFSAGMIEETRQCLGTNAARFQFAVIDAQELPYPDDSFDCVIANHMLYHVPNRTRACAEIRRVLRPAGHFYAATTGQKHLLEIQQLGERAGINPGGVLDSSSTLIFNLQNGPEQMEPWFSQIETRPFPGNLAVTETEPLVAFILSAIPPENIDEARLHRLRALIDTEIAERGSVHITKETGLFVAYGGKVQG